MENVKARGAVETIGIIGGGQLGSMLARVGLQWGYEVVVLDPSASAPAGKIASRHIVGDYTCPFAMAELVKTCDRITYEFEHLPEALIAGLKQAQAVTVPSLETLEIIQDKYRQKEHLRSHGLPVAPDCKGSGPLGKGFREFLDLHGEIVIKCTHGGYDGKGTYFVGGKEALAEALDYYGGAPVYAEAVVPFVKELSVMVAKRGDEIVAYPVVENCHDSGILVQTTVPAGVSEAAEKGAREIALAGVATFNSDGLFCVEMFLTGDGSIVINEIAPRAHNSGHYTIEACDISQYETWLRLLVDLPLVQPMLLSPAAMVNVLGPVGVEGPYKVRGLDALAGVPNTKFHLYGKANTGARKKLGHITSLGSSAGEALERAQLALDAVGIESSIFDAPLPQVGIIMGSQSDLRIMGDAAVVLKEFGIPYEIKVVSAHRTPKRLFGYGESARDRGLKVIIAGAGGAAHLPGMMASITTLPVIGVPVKLKALDGMDSLLSIVQMPGGIPVATVGVDNAKNAGLLAVRILAAFDPGIFEQLDRYMKKISAGVVYDLEEVL